MCLEKHRVCAQVLRGEINLTNHVGQFVQDLEARLGSVPWYAACAANHGARL